MDSQFPMSSSQQYGGLEKSEQRTLSDVISETFPAFDHRGTIIEPFDNEAKRDAEFQESEYMRLCLSHQNLTYC